MAPDDGPVSPPDPKLRHRAGVALAATVLMVLSGFLADVIVDPAGDGEGSFARDEVGVEALVLALVAAAACLAALRPQKPDARVARYVMLAAAVIGIVVGVNALVAGNEQPEGLERLVIEDRSPGPGTWTLLASGALFLYLFWRKDLWPESAWVAAIERRTSMRR